MTRPERFPGKFDVCRRAERALETYRLPADQLVGRTMQGCQQSSLLTKKMVDCGNSRSPLGSIHLSIGFDSMHYSFVKKRLSRVSFLGLLADLILALLTKRPNQMRV